MPSSSVSGFPYVQYDKDHLVFGNGHVLVRVELDRFVNPCLILDRATGRQFADSDYLYEIGIEKKFKSKRLMLHSVTTRMSGDRSLEVTLTGRPDFPKGNSTADIVVSQTFTVPADRPYFEERMSIRNLSDKSCKVDNIRFGFRKKLFDGKIAKGFSGFKLYSLPFQRYWGQRLDRKYDLFAMSDLIMGKGGIPGYASEGWMLTDKTDGFLVTKHSPALIEFSVFDRRKSRGAVYLVLGGVGFYRGDPEEATELEAGSEMSFGTTRYEFFKGGFEQGCYTFRAHMDSLGHVAPKDYKPRIFWNVLYNLDFKLSDPNIRPYSLKQLRRESELAKEMGCETLYLDPQWDTVMGSTIWDTRRLGPMKRFAAMIRREYGLDLALHMMMNTDSEKEYEGCYRVNGRGRIQKWAMLLSTICAPTKWKEMKKKRVAKLCDDGAHWLMFDFTDYPRGTECRDRDHPHHMPLRRCEHANAIYEVISHIKKRYPGVCVEAHDRIASGPQDYHQMHYQHSGPHTFDEGWAFEMMWDSMGDLL